MAEEYCSLKFPKVYRHSNLQRKVISPNPTPHSAGRSAQGAALSTAILTLLGAALITSAYLVGNIGFG